MSATNAARRRHPHEAKIASGSREADGHSAHAHFLEGRLPLGHERICAAANLRARMSKV